jgi:TonB-linked SusC/RagA family outer membrane protein
MRKIMLMLAFFFLLGMQVYAQKTVTGTVTSADDGSTFPGVSVVVKGTTVGTVTDIDGKYTLNVPSDGTYLVFSFVGMVTQEVTISGSVVNCILVTEALSLEEIVVTAVGIKRDEKSLGYSATKVGGEEFERSSSRDAMNSLQGKVAGVSVTSGGGMPGASTKVIIRGYSSLTGNNNPLYVVDGVPIDNSSRVDGEASTGLDFGNRANDINPNDIESMTILKGASATALYGSRASSGVIVITTKSGKNNTGLTVEYNTSASVSDVLRLPEMQNTFGQGWDGTWVDDENGSWGSKFDGVVRPWGNVYNNSQKLREYSAIEDNLYEFYEYGKQFSNSLSLTGGTDKSSFYFSYGNTSADGIVPTDADHNKKNTLKFNGSTSGKYLTANVNVSYINRNGSLNPDGNGGTSSAANIYSEVLQVPRNFSFVEFEDYLNDPFNTLDYYFTPYAFNPYYALNENKSAYMENRFYGSFSLDCKINDWINATYRVGVDASDFNRNEWESIMEFTPGTPQFIKQTSTNPGYYLEQTSTTTSFNQALMLTASKDIGDFTIDGTLGYDVNSYDYKLLQSEINSLVIPYFYNIENSSTPPVSVTDIAKKRQYAYFATFTFDYSDFVYLNLTAREEFSSTLPADNNSFFYPSASLSFLVDKLIPSASSFADMLKIRVSWGQAGKDAQPYRIFPVYGSTAVANPYGNLIFPLNGVGAFELSNRIGNLNLQPEITTEQEIGFDFRFFKSRLTIDASLYNKVSDGQILDVDIAPSSGFSQQVINFGKVQNKGLELLVGLTPVKKDNFTWNLLVNFTKNNSLVLELPDGASEQILYSLSYGVDLVAIEGEPLGIYKTYDYARVDQNDHDSPIICSSETGLPTYATDYVPVGDINPDYILGATNSFNFLKDFDFSFTLDYRPGGMFYSGTADLNYFTGNATQTTFNDRQPFLVENSVILNPAYESDNTQPQYLENNVFINVANIGDYYYHTNNPVSNMMRLLPRDYFKVRDISLAYTLPSKVISKIKLQSVQLVLSANNVWLWTPAENNFVDPESTSFGNDLISEFGEFRTAPTVRSFTASLRVKF